MSPARQSCPYAHYEGMLDSGRIILLIFIQTRSWVKLQASGPCRFTPRGGSSGGVENQSGSLGENISILPLP